MLLKILYRDESIIAIEKPTGIMVHPSTLSNDKVFIMHMLRDQIGKRVFPVHRLDRATSGVLLMALDSKTAALLSDYFRYGQITKRYRALVRGWVGSDTIDYTLLNERGDRRDRAVTDYSMVEQFEFSIPHGKFETVRYSMVDVRPHTGRKHQIRRHFKHIFHPVIGDTTYGDLAHNKIVKEHFGINRLVLHACSLEFDHPWTKEKLTITSEGEYFFDGHSLFGNNKGLMVAPKAGAVTLRN